MNSPNSCHVDIANQYVEDVLSGRIPVGEKARLGCERQVRDLKRTDWQYEFDEKRASKVCRFIEMMPHTKGKWAGQKMKLEPWQVFIVTTIFGWVDKITRLRRFAEAYIQVPRKNGKSQLAASIANYMFIADGEPGAEIYCGATTEKQALEVFRPAKAMLEKCPAIVDRFGLELFKKSLFSTVSGSRFEPVIGHPNDGSSPHFAICDEYHQHDTSDMVDTMITGMGAREQPLMLEITTAGFNLSGPCKVQHDNIERMLRGIDVDETVFGIIYDIDKDDDWKDFSVWKKANPNYGVSVFESNLYKLYQTALHRADKQNSILTKNLNVWCSVNTAWMNMAKLARCVDSDITPQRVVSEYDDVRSVIGVDLAEKRDLTAAVLVFFNDDHVWAFPKFFIPESLLSEAQNEHYRTWCAQGIMTATPGETTDLTFVEQTIKEWMTEFNCEEVDYDPYHASYFAQRLEDEGITAVEVKPNVANMSEAMKQCEADIYDGKFCYDSNPILTWNFSNIVAHRDAKENIYPRKERYENKIDGVMALLTAYSVIMRKRNEPKESCGMFFL